MTQLSFSSMLLGLNGLVSFLSFINCWKGEVEVNTDREKANLIRGSPGTQDAMLGVLLEKISWVAGLVQKAVAGIWGLVPGYRM